MNRSLYAKLVLIFTLLIVSLLLVVGGFLVRGIQSFYVEEFYQQMAGVIENSDLVDSLRGAVEELDAADAMTDAMSAYVSALGISQGSREYFILTGDTGAYIEGSNPEQGQNLSITRNILKAMSGEVGAQPDNTKDYMDVAIPVSGESGDYIVYIKDNKQTVQSLNQQLFRIILGAMVVGLVISLLLGMLLSKTLVTPIQRLTKAAELVADGDFSEMPESDAKDEIGVLTRTFGDMSQQLENTMEDLKRSEATRREFVANVSHELRTPITSIKSYAETLVDSEEMAPDMKRGFLSVIATESDRMTSIVQDLLTLSRFDSGVYGLSFEEFSFEKSVKDVYNAMVLEAQSRNQRFSLVFTSKVPPIIGDRPRVEQVLMNMVSNAMKYTPNGGRIDMTVGRADEVVWARVRDNGVGIPSDDVPYVFDRFYRVDKARSRDSGGTGLGLSIAKEIIEQHDGSIRLKSQEGEGTVITIILPVEGPQNA